MKLNALHQLKILKHLCTNKEQQQKKNHTDFEKKYLENKDCVLNYIVILA